MYAVHMQYVYSVYAVCVECMMYAHYVSNFVNSLCSTGFNLGQPCMHFLQYACTSFLFTEEVKMLALFML